MTGLHTPLALAGPARAGPPAATGHHTVAIQQVRHILQGARHQGLAVAPLLARAGIPTALLDAPLARVSLAQYAALIRVLRRSLRDELWGLTRQPLRVGSFAQCAQGMVGCGTLGEALRLGLRQLHLLAADFTGRLLVQGDTARLQIVLRRAPDARLDYAQKAVLLFAFGLASWLVARRVPLLGVDYTDPMPGSDSSRVYQAPILQNQPHIGLRFEARWLALPVQQNPHSLRAFLARAPANLLVAYRDPAGVTERIRSLLLRRLEGPLPALDEVGRELGLAAPTLRRRLREEGRGFQQLKDELRRDSAIAWLAQPELGLPEIAGRLGFSEPSTFQRAFKRWTGLAPGAYRLARLSPGAGSGAGHTAAPSAPAGPVPPPP